MFKIILIIYLKLFKVVELVSVDFVSAVDDIFFVDVVSSSDDVSSVVVVVVVVVRGQKVARALIRFNDWHVSEIASSES